MRRDQPEPAQDLAAHAASTPALRQVTAFTRWVGAGRRLTQTGRLTLADARELVGLLDTGDTVDPDIGGRVYRTRSSEDLRGLNTVVEWAKATGLVRVVHGRLVPVKKNARLVDRPRELWAAMFEAFPRLGAAICPSGWYASLLDADFPDAVAILFATIADGDGSAHVDDINERIWSTLVVRYRMDDATSLQLEHWRGITDRDIRFTLDRLVGLGALDEDEPGTVTVTQLTDWVLRRAYSVTAPGERLAELRVTLLGTDPPVWRRLIVPMSIRLDRLHVIMQAAMGWTNSHLHMFAHPTGDYGRPDPDLPMRDDRSATLRDLAADAGDAFRYEYDFGDGWEHQVVLERLVDVDPNRRYPACVAGERACPPEDCGGTPGYAELIETLADPGHPDHDDMLRWLGLDKSGDFDPARFDPADANRRIDAVVHGAFAPRASPPDAAQASSRPAAP